MSTTSTLTKERLLTKQHKNRKDLRNYKDLDKSSKESKAKNINNVSDFLKKNDFTRTRAMVDASNKQLLEDVLKEEYKEYFSKDKNYSFEGFVQYKAIHSESVSRCLAYEQYTENQTTGFSLLNKRVKRVFKKTQKQLTVAA